MGKAALTFAEVFIVLGLIFLIQTVANFNVFEGASLAESADMVVLSVRQVPSKNDATDHINYILVRDGSTEIAIQLSSGNVVSASDIAYRVDGGGRCTAATPIQIGYELQAADPNKFVRFAAFLRESFGISYSRIEVSDAQPEHVFSWRPAQLREETALTVGVHHCTISPIPTNLKVDPRWGLPRSELDYPHPLIISINVYKESISEEPPRLMYTNYHQLPSGPLGKLIGPQHAGYAFSSHIQNCDLGTSTKDFVHQYVSQEIEWSLSDY